MATSDLVLQAHQILSLEATERQLVTWEEEKEIAILHVSHRRSIQLAQERHDQLRRKFEESAASRNRTVQRKLIALDGEEQKIRLAILKAEMLQLESLVRSCTRSVRGEVFVEAQDAQQRIKYFNKTLDVILKKESAARRDIFNSERYEFLVLRQRLDKEAMDFQRSVQVTKARHTKQQLHDNERKRQEESHQKRMSLAPGYDGASSTSAGRQSIATIGSEPRQDRQDQHKTEHEEEQVDKREEAVAPPPAAADEKTHAPADDSQHYSDDEDHASNHDDESNASPQRDAHDDLPIETHQESIEHPPKVSSPPSEHSSRASSAASRSRSASSSSSRSSDDETPARHRKAESPKPVAAGPAAPRLKSVNQHQDHQGKTAKAKSTTTATTANAPPAAAVISKSAPQQHEGENHYEHVRPIVSIAHSAAFFERAFTEHAAREDMKRAEIEASAATKWNQLQRHFRYVRLRIEENEREMTLVKNGHPESLERCWQRAVRRMMEDEQRTRERLTAEGDAVFGSIIKKVNRTTLQDRHEQSLRVAKLNSHTNRIARKLQRLEAERMQLSKAAKESASALKVGDSKPNEADTALTAIGESQPYPAREEQLSQMLTEKLTDVETKRRKFVERECLLRRMVLQIYHRQKLKDFGFFDESKLRDEQMRLAESLRDEEATEALKQLAFLDARIAAAQQASQSRLRLTRDRDRLLRDEHTARNDIFSRRLDELSELELRWKGIQRLHTSFDNLHAAEAAARKHLVKDEARIREGAVGSFYRYQPQTFAKAIDPLPVPPPKFEDAVRLYQEFFRKRHHHHHTGSANTTLSNRGGAGGASTPGSEQQRQEPLAATTYFSTSGRKYLPPPKKHLPSSALTIMHKDMVLTVSDMSSRGLGKSVSAIDSMVWRSDQKSSSKTPPPPIARKPRPPPRDVVLHSIATAHLKPTPRNAKAGARLEPMKPSQPAASKKSKQGGDVGGTRSNRKHQQPTTTTVTNNRRSSDHTAKQQQQPTATSTERAAVQAAPSASGDAPPPMIDASHSKRSASSASYESQMSNHSRNHSRSSSSSSSSSSGNDTAPRAATDSTDVSPARHSEYTSDASPARAHDDEDAVKRKHQKDLASHSGGGGGGIGVVGDNEPSPAKSAGTATDEYAVDTFEDEEEL